MAIKKKVLLVDDDIALRASLAEQLCMIEGFQATEIGTGIAALEVTKAERFDVIVLDIGLPDMDGREVCRLMRRNGVKTPIIMLTGKVTDADEILGLGAGANDYITKPFFMNIFLARLRAQLRQHERSDDAVCTIGPYAFKPADKTLIDAVTDKRLKLTEKETAVLKFLFRMGNTIISRETLLKEVWGHDARMSTHTLETHIYRLRQKVEADPSNPKLLVSEAGGYQLNV